LARQENEGFLAQKPMPIVKSAFLLSMAKKIRADFNVYKPEGRTSFLPR
jgi:hypothetical protein